MSIFAPDEYESQLYKIDNSAILNNDTDPFEVIFLNRSFNTKVEDVAKPDGEDGKVARPPVPPKISFKGFALKSDVDGIGVDISAPNFGDLPQSGKVIVDTDNITETFGKIQIKWNENFPGTYPAPTDPNNIVCGRRIIATITPKDDIDDIFNILFADISILLLNLAYGSVEMNRAVLGVLEENRKFASYSTDYPLAFSILAIMSPRKTLTGWLKNDIKAVKLKRCDHIIVTADRSYSTRGSSKVIYVNCALIVAKLKPNDYIHIDDITLRVVKQVRLSVDCLVVQEGILRPGRQVHLPCHLTLNQVTVEEIQDITFANESNINTLVLPAPGCSAYYNSIRCVMKLLQTMNFRIIARVTSSMVCSEEYAKWIADTYDGIILVVDEDPKPHRVIRFTDNIRYLIKRFYSMKKAVIMSNFISKKCIENQIITADPKDEKHFFYHTDAYLLNPYEINNIHLAIVRAINDDILARISDYAMEDLNAPFEDKSFTGSDTLARSVVRASYEINASAIIVTTSSGRMVQKISHFRPKCPIIALTKNIFLVHYLKIFHNVCVAYYKEGEIEKKRLGQRRIQFIIKKLVFGVLYAITSRTIQVEDEAVIIFGYKYFRNAGHAHRFVGFKINVEIVQAIYSSIK